MKNILVTGSAGQISSELIPALAERGYNIISSDIREPPEEELEFSTFVKLDVTDIEAMEKVVQEYNIEGIIHNASILSAKGEENPYLAMNVNIRGIENILTVAQRNEVERVLSPSSIAAFGPSTPKIDTPNDTIMRPTTIYGISKVYTELLGEYFHHRFGVDFRSIRYPGIVSAKTLPGGGTTDWAVEIFYEALQSKKYTCFVKPDTLMPMMLMPDCINATIKLFEVDENKLVHRSFNVAAISFSPEMLAEEIMKHIPDFEISYAPDYRQQIADSWPKSIDDSIARNEWGWKPSYGLGELVTYMLDELSKKLKSTVLNS
ncbi:MAG: NAD-dependent epimerase/dehydratase family protein [Methanobacteriota archaeon]|nr:MAG: NAD-dependent epimerase/dehydratase family protein [Euryarchaeota archaeon]